MTSVDVTRNPSGDAVKTFVVSFDSARAVEAAAVVASKASARVRRVFMGVLSMMWA